jgi:hypothetical protein
MQLDGSGTTWLIPGWYFQKYSDEPGWPTKLQLYISRIYKEKTLPEQGFKD